MPELFASGKIGTLEIKNRMIRTASHEGLADATGMPSEEQFNFYKGFVDGGIGLVITGYAGIMQSGKSALYHMTMINSDDLIPAHKKMVDKIHAIGGKIILQICHCGRQSWSYETKEPVLVAPSSIACGFYKEVPRELNEDEIYKIIENFALAAKRAKAAGYDGVQIHAAHGYLLSTFLSAHSNKRKDKWGGSRENRFRIVGEILRAVRNAVGKDYPVLLKVNCYEKPSNGMKPEECVEIAKLVEKIKCCDAIEVSSGTNEDGFVMARGGLPIEGTLKYMRPYCKMNSFAKFFFRIFGPTLKFFQPPFTEGYNLGTSAMIKKATSLTVITVGGMRSKEFMNSAIKEGKTDFVSMARPLLLEPDLANKFLNGISEKSECDNCSICVIAADSVPIKCHKDEFKK